MGELTSSEVQYYVNIIGVDSEETKDVQAVACQL